MSGSAQGAQSLFADARSPSTVVPIVVLVVRARSFCLSGNVLLGLGNSRTSRFPSATYSPTCHFCRELLVFRRYRKG